MFSTPNCAHHLFALMHIFFTCERVCCCCWTSDNEKQTHNRSQHFKRGCFAITQGTTWIYSAQCDISVFYCRLLTLPFSPSSPPANDFRLRIWAAARKDGGRGTLYRFFVLDSIYRSYMAELNSAWKLLSPEYLVRRLAASCRRGWNEGAAARSEINVPILRDLKQRLT